MEREIKVFIDGKECECRIEGGKVIAELPKVFNSRWKPKQGGEGFFIQVYGTVESDAVDYDFPKDEKAVSVGNSFKTREIAKSEAKRESLMRRMRGFARENGGPGRWTIEYNKKNNELYAVHHSSKELIDFGAVTFIGLPVANEAARRYGEEIMFYYAGGR